MFAEELYAKIRDYTPPPVDEQKSKKELKREQKIERRVEKDAQYLWEKLKELYVSNVPYFAEHEMHMASVSLIIANDRTTRNMPYMVYYQLGLCYDRLLSHRMIKYPKPTFMHLIQIALDNGLDVRKTSKMRSPLNCETPTYVYLCYEFSLPSLCNLGAKGVLK